MYLVRTFTFSWISAKVRICHHWISHLQLSLKFGKCIWYEDRVRSRKFCHIKLPWINTYIVYYVRPSKLVTQEADTPGCLRILKTLQNPSYFYEGFWRVQCSIVSLSLQSYRVSDLYVIWLYLKILIIHLIILPLWSKFEVRRIFCLNLFLSNILSLAFLIFDWV